MPDLKTDIPGDQQVTDTLRSKSDILQRLASEPSMVVTDRDPDVEIEVNGNVVYDSHAEGHLPLAKGVRCWALDRAPHEKEPGDSPDISG